MIERIQVINGDCLVEMKRMIEDGEQVDSCVCDPPYHLTSIVKRFGSKNAAPNKFGTDGAYSRASRGFMGKEWDGGDIAFQVETWRLVYDLLKPGGYLIAFSGTRTYHRMAVAIEDAGFEIRDQIGWLYGSGFPKSHNIGKALDRMAGAEREVGQVAGRSGAGRNCMAGDFKGGEYMESAPATPEAQQWDGWGTALKPAWEPIVVARKPISEKSIADNVLKHGTGAINIDGCRVGDGSDRESVGVAKSESVFQSGNQIQRPDGGRFPANVIHDGSDEVVAAFPETNSGGQPSPGTVDGGVFENRYKERSLVNHGTNEGSAARFFYSAKADSDDRMGSKHPTVKPIDLMAYLCRMVTPPGGRVLDPFAGSGSTGIGAAREGFQAVLIERESEYYNDILNRLKFVQGTDTPLFCLDQ